MTRINVINVEELTDNFLMAEYYELPRVFVLVENHIRSGKQPLDVLSLVPSTYRFGKGHVSFFYDKLQWLYERHLNLGIAGSGRNLPMRVDPLTTRANPIGFVGTSYWGNYIPTPEAIQLNWDRLQFRRKYDGGIYRGSR